MNSLAGSTAREGAVRTLVPDRPPAGGGESGAMLGLLSMVIDQVDQGLALLDADARVLLTNQAFRRAGPPPPGAAPTDGRPPDLRHPFEKAVDHLAKTFPLKTPEWTAWSANMRPARLEGTWALSGWAPGKGPIYGRVVLTPAGSDGDEFTSQITFTYARSGQQVTRTGRVAIYTGFQWRGRSTAGGAEDSAWREVMFVEPDWSAIEGRWFSGGYDELGPDVRLTRIGKSLPADQVTAESIGLLAFRGRGRGAFIDMVERLIRTSEGTSSWFLRAIDRLADSQDIASARAGCVVGRNSPNFSAR